VIITKPKPVVEIFEFTEKFDKLMIVGCGGCASVCSAGGEKEVEKLSRELQKLYEEHNKTVVITTSVVVRQCDHKYLEEIDAQVKKADAIVSLGCGVGVQFLAERYNDKLVLPGLNTLSAGGTVQPGVWEERCGLCGKCMLHQTGGVCPVARCAKSIQNGPCGGSQNGKCEIDPNIPCAWHLIYERLLVAGRLDLMMKYRPPKDWSKDRVRSFQNNKE